MPKSNHKYRVTVYLGKEIYTQLEAQARVFNMSIATLTKLLIDTGFAFANQIDKGTKSNG